MSFLPQISATPIKERGFFARIIGIDRDREVIGAIRNALIAGDFSGVAAIVADAGPDVLKAARPEISQLLEEVLFQVARDGRFEQDEREYVQAFVKAAAFPRSESGRIYHLAVRRALREIVQSAVQDGKVTNDEMEKLNAVSTRFDIDDAEWKKMYESVAAECVSETLRTALADGMLSDDEWHHAQQLGKQLRVSLAFKPKTEEELGYARARWRALNGHLDVIGAPGLALGEEEAAYFDGQCEWFELRASPRQVTYGDLTGSVRIAKGLSFHYSAVRVTTPPSETMQPIDSGRLILTNERLIFMGDKANQSIWWRTALAINVLSATEFEVQRSSGKSPTLACTEASFERLFLASSIAAGLINRKYVEPTADAS